MKRCTKCEEEKNEIEFPKRSTNKDGLYSWCKECCRNISNKYRLEFPEKVQEMRLKRREKALETARIYKKLNKKTLEKKRLIYYKENAEKLKEKARNYAKNLTTEQKERRKQYYLKWKETESGKEYTRNHSKIIAKKYRHIKQAGQKVKDAIKYGKLIRPKNCCLCGSENKIEGHHADYDKPLEVIWVCQKCHRMIHKRIKEEKI